MSSNSDVVKSGKSIPKNVVDAIRVLHDHCMLYGRDCIDCPFGRVDYLSESVKCLLTSVNRPDEILQHIKVKEVYEVDQKGVYK